MKKQKLVSVKEAIDAINEAFQNDPKKSGRSVLAVQTIYNAMNKGKLKRYGSRHFRQVDLNELLAVYGPKQTA